MHLLIQREFVVDVPPERAWDHLARVEAWTSWAKHIKRVAAQPPGELSSSTVAVFRLAYGIQAQFAVTEFVPKSHWMWSSKFLGLLVHYDHRFEAIDDGRTKVQFIIEARDVGFGKFVIGKLYASIYSRNLDRAIPNLVTEINAHLGGLP